MNTLLIGRRGEAKGVTGWQQFKNKHPKMAQRIADRFIDNFCVR